MPGFLRALSGALDQAGLRWVVLRNPEDLPDRVGRDVDIIVHPDDEDRLGLLVKKVVRQRGLFLVRVNPENDLHQSYNVAAADLQGRFLLHLDVQTAARYRGRILVDAEDLLAHRRRTDEGFWALSPGMEAYALLLHTSLHKRELKRKYASRLIALEAEAPGELEHIATARLGKKLGRRLANVRGEQQLLAAQRDLRRALDRRYPGNLWRMRRFKVLRWTRVLRIALRPRGLFVVFLGPDGAGKSTTTDLLVQMLSVQSNPLPVHRVYLGSGTPLLPTRKLMRWIRRRSRAEKRKHRRDVRPAHMRSALHVMADEIARYWLNVRPKLSPHGIVIADRYAYDVLRVNHRIVRRPWFRRVALAVTPAPDITFFLEGDPATIAERKQELTLAETIRQQEAYRQLAGLVPGFRTLDLTTRDEAALRDVALQILDEFAARNGGLPRPLNLG